MGADHFRRVLRDCARDAADKHSRENGASASAYTEARAATAAAPAPAFGNPLRCTGACSP